jgi:hypothetical protein
MQNHQIRFNATLGPELMNSSPTADNRIAYVR